MKSNIRLIKRKYQKALDKNNTQLKIQEKISKIDIITEGVMEYS